MSARERHVVVTGKVVGSLPSAFGLDRHLRCLLSWSRFADDDSVAHPALQSRGFWDDLTSFTFGIEIENLGPRARAGM